MKWFTVTFSLSLFCIGAALAADGDLQFAEFEQCRLAGGDSITNCRIGYRTYGTLNQDRSNAVLMPTWFTGRSEDHFNNDFIGKDKTIDSSKFFVISVDALSNGVSSSPSHNSEAEYPDIAISDMVDSQYRLLTEILDIHQLHAVVGISMGGMQTFEWVVRYPNFVDKAVPITGTPKQTAYDLLLWDTQLKTIQLLGDSEAGVKIVAGIDGLTLYSPDYVVSNFEPGRFGDFIEPNIVEGSNRGLVDRIPQLQAMISHDVTMSFEGEMAPTTDRVKADMLIVVSPTDHMVNPQPSRQFAESLDTRVIEFDGTCGHVDSFCGRDWLAPMVRDFLAED